MFPLLGALAGGLVSGLGSSLFNRMSQSYATDLSKEMGSYNSELQLNTLAHSGNAQRQADKALGRSSAFAQHGISVPPSSTPSPSPMPVNMDSLANNISALSQMQVNKQSVNTGKAQENLINEQANTEIKKQNEIDANIRHIDSDINKNSATIGNLNANTELLNKYVSRYDDITNAQIKKMESESHSIDVHTGLDIKKLPYELKQMSAVIYNLQSSAQLSQAQANVAYANIRLIDQQIENLKEQAPLFRQQFH